MLTDTMFFLVKKVDNSTPIVDASNNPNADVVVRLAGGSAVSSQFTTIDLGNGFYLAQVENYAVVGTSTSTVNIQNSSGVDTFISMVQLEERSSSTSYIETLNGTIETRTKDIASKTGLSDYINSSEGTVYFHLKGLADSGNSRVISLSDNSGNNFIQLKVVNNQIATGLKINNLVIVDAIIDNSTSILNYYKVAIVWSSTKFAFFVNGSKIGEQLVDASFPNNTLNTFTFNNAVVGGGANYEGKVKELEVYTTEYTDSEAIDLTTL